MKHWWCEMSEHCPLPLHNKVKIRHVRTRMKLMRGMIEQWIDPMCMTRPLTPSIPIRFVCTHEATELHFYRGNDKDFFPCSYSRHVVTIGDPSSFLQTTSQDFSWEVRGPARARPESGQLIREGTHKKWNLVSV